MTERMKTEFSKFCENYAEVLQPLRGILRDSVENLRDKPDADTLKAALSGLTDLHHRLKNLLDKVEDQQAYVIIFGPLKSGKSTLMNAISSAYVSEVSSLPAYPCLVYVRHAGKPEIVVTKYNGRIEEYADSAAMQESIAGHHRELADRIRETEELGDVFDPGSHFTEAIRRIDIGLPAETLKQSYTVLVDTPGLYSRMRFGYDLMTREFRDSAACAVFVVKTDNLFLEQVFEEFNDLLDLFSRIFLVVNIDANKRDLGPDGQLRPSLESKQPDRIIEAFRSLSMSAPLRRACDEGRLRIYPIDLLNSAAASLQTGAGSNGSGDDTAEGEPRDFLLPQKPPQGSEDTAGPGTIWAGFRGHPGLPAAIAAAKPAAAGNGGETPLFDRFLADLTDYLNSNDYLINFMRDSLRQGRTLVAEVRDHVSADCLAGFRARMHELDQEIDRQQRRRDAVGNLDEVDWPAAFAASRGVCEADGEQFAEAEKLRLHSELSGRVDQWFTTDESLEDLLREHVRPGIQACMDRIRQDAAGRIKRLTGGSRCGADLSGNVMHAMDVAGLSLTAIQASESIQAGEPKAVDLGYDDSISLAALPVRKTIWDWLLCRTLAKVRRRTFGPTEQPDHAIPSKVKVGRLGDVGKLALEGEISAMLDRAFPGVSKRLSGELLEGYASRFSDAITARLDQVRTDLDKSLPQLKDRLEDAREILATLDQLSADAADVGHGIDELEQELADSHPPAVQPSSGDDDTSGMDDDFVRMPSLLDDDEDEVTSVDMGADQGRPAERPPYRPAVSAATLTSVWVSAIRSIPVTAATLAGPEPAAEGAGSGVSDPEADTVKLDGGGAAGAAEAGKDTAAPYRPAVGANTLTSVWVAAIRETPGTAEASDPAATGGSGGQRDVQAAATAPPPGPAAHAAFAPSPVPSSQLPKPNLPRPVAARPAVPPPSPGGRPGV